VFASVIILEIDIEDVALIAVFEAKGQAPIAADRHREGSGSIAKEGMESASPAQVAGTGGPVDRVEHQAHALPKFRPDAARPPGKENLFHENAQSRSLSV
jgi:hypothetical protein